MIRWADLQITDTRTTWSATTAFQCLIITSHSDSNAFLVLFFWFFTWFWNLLHVVVANYEITRKQWPTANIVYLFVPNSCKYYHKYLSVKRFMLWLFFRRAVHLCWALSLWGDIGRGRSYNKAENLTFISIWN